MNFFAEIGAIALLFSFIDAISRRFGSEGFRTGSEKIRAYFYWAGLIFFALQDFFFVWVHSRRGDGLSYFVESLLIFLFFVVVAFLAPTKSQITKKFGKTTFGLAMLVEAAQLALIATLFVNLSFAAQVAVERATQNPGRINSMDSRASTSSGT